MDRTFTLPYGQEHAKLTIVTDRIIGVLSPDTAGTEECLSASEIVEDALEHPIASPPLERLAAGKKDIVIIISDHTRPVPSRMLLPPMLRRIRKSAPKARVRLLVATGCHRAMTREELICKLGDEIAGTEEIVIHDCDHEAELVPLGTMPSGQELKIDRAAAEADLLISEGFIEPHFFAGFSGGRKSILPGIASRSAVVGNHCAEFIDDPCARTGVLDGNPIHRDMLWAAKQAGLGFILNVVLDEQKRILRAFAGDPVKAHEAGCSFVASRCTVYGKSSDIVITTNGGYPLDQNVYQAVKGMTAAEPIVKQGGVIIMLARCSDGIGGDHFYRQIAECPGITEQLAEFRSRRRGETLPDQWQSQILFRILQKARVILVSEMPEETVRKMRMIPAHDPGEALRIAEDLLGDPAATVTVIPDGVSVITKLH